MRVYEWTGDSVFHDNRNDRTIQPGEQVELAPEVAEGHREFVEVEQTADESDTDTSGESVDVSAFSGKDWQSMAADYDGFEDVNGQSEADDIQAAFEGLSEEEQAAALEAFDGE